MHSKRAVLAITFLWLLAPLFSGCAVDPMERLADDIKSQDRPTRERAILQLANLEDERTIPPLVDVLEGDDELCDIAGVALVKKGREVEAPDPKQPNPVIDELAKVVNSPHLAERFRCRATWALGEIGDRRAIPALQAAQAAKLGDKPALLVQDQAKQALEKLGFFSDGRPFDLGPQALVGQLSVLPQPPALAVPAPK
jgi:HEAT repeat protein